MLLSKFIRRFWPSQDGTPAMARAEDSKLLRARRLHDGGDVAGAQFLYEQVLRRDSSNAEAQCRLGIILGQQGRYSAAETLLRKALEQRPSFVDALNALGNVTKMQERWTDAKNCYERALALCPESAAIWSNLGLCLREAREFIAAESALRRALDLTPDSAEVLLNLAMVRGDQGRADDARALLQRCLVIDPNLAEAHTGLAHVLLQSGEFDAGWREYEWRFQCADAERQRSYPMPHWDGRRLSEQTLLVRAEQGLGDQLMFASCLHEVVERSQRTVIECEPRLVNLFARSFPQTSVYAYHAKRDPEWQALHAPDYQIHMGSLPALSRHSAADFAGCGAYLRADAADIRFWQSRLATLGAGLKIGISWRGGAPRTRRRQRTVPLSEWLPVLSQAASFVSLQYGECRGDIDALAKGAKITVHHWSEAIEDYNQTAALVSALDLVISVQTAVVHLGGALGKKVWVLVPAAPEWRYMAVGRAMLWYPDVTLLRQQKHDSWGPVISEAAQALSKQIQSAHRPSTS